MDVVTSLPADTQLCDVGDRIRRIEALGFDTVHISETVRDPFAVCALALEHSSTLAIRTSMVVAFARSPMVTAYAAWELARFSGGRFELGIATQVRGNIVGRFSMPWTDPVGQLRDYVASLRAIFSAFADGRNVDHRGSHYTFSRLQPYFTPVRSVYPHPRSGRRRQPSNVHPGRSRRRWLCGPPDEFESSHVARLRPARVAGRCNGQGRPTAAHKWSPCRRVIAGRDEAALVAARDDVRAELAFLYSTPAYQRTLELFGLHEVGTRLSELAHEKNWPALAGCAERRHPRPTRPAGNVLGAARCRSRPGMAACATGSRSILRPIRSTAREFRAMVDRIRAIPAPPG